MPDLFARHFEGATPIAVRVRRGQLDEALRDAERRAHELDAFHLTVWLQEPLDTFEHRALGQWLAQTPWPSLQILDPPRTDTIDFLRHYPGLKELHIEVPELKTLDALADLPEGLEALGLGAFGSGSVSLDRVPRLDSLIDLHIEGNSRGLEQLLADLPQLRRLSLRSVRLADARPLLPLERLEMLELRLGSAGDMAGIAGIGRLKYLEIWRVRGLTEVGFLADMPHLQLVVLQALGKVERLPGLAGARSLRRLVLESMLGLEDLSGIAEAPALEDLGLIDMRTIEVEALSALAAHPTLRRVIYGLGSDRRNQSAYEMLRRPAGLQHPFEFH